MKNKLTTQQMREATLDVLGLIARCVETSGAAYFNQFAGPCELIVAHAFAIEESMSCGKCKKKKSKKKAARK